MYFTVLHKFLLIRLIHFYYFYLGLLKLHFILSDTSLTILVFLSKLFNLVFNVPLFLLLKRFINLMCSRIRSKNLNQSCKWSKLLSIQFNIMRLLPILQLINFENISSTWCKEKMDRKGNKIIYNFLEAVFSLNVFSICIKFIELKILFSCWRKRESEWMGLLWTQMDFLEMILTFRPFEMLAIKLPVYLATNLTIHETYL